MSTVGFIGLGTMGRPMAKNLIKAGHELVFFARKPEIAAEFTALGARQAASPAAVTKAAEFIVTIVTADQQLTEIALGPDGILAGAAQGKTLIDMSTVAPQTEQTIAAKLAERGMAMIDAPVSGGPWGAESGTLTIMVGGTSEEFDRSKPVLDAMGKKVFHLGAVGAGQTVKLINQMVGGGIMTLISEGFVLGQSAGVNLEQLLEVMLVSSASSTVLEARGRKFLLSDNYVPGFMTELMRKDMSLAVTMADRLKVPTPVAASALQQYTSAMNQGHSEKDFSAVIKVCENAAGVKISAAK